MNISYNWLKDFINFDLTPQEVLVALTSIGLETEGIEEIETIKGGLNGLIIGEVLTCVGHPDSDHLHLTTVNIGNAEPLKIVCGAPNVAAGQKVVVATIGTILYSGDESFTIRKSKIRGEESMGMICSEVEIGLGTGSDGIIVLPADATIGMPAKEYYNIQSEYVLDIDITPNRSDALSHYGVARDLAAYLKQNGKTVALTKPNVDKFSIDSAEGGIKVNVENKEACPRYAGVTIKGVEVKESPKWLKDRLTFIGLRPINNVVDSTNYVLHELGHPLHAFDAKYIAGNTISVQTLPAKTKFVALDNQVLELDARDLMICSAEEGLCIGGVFGGLHSGVTDNTTDVFLECAYFHPTWVRKTARRHGLNTDSSFRFERGCDPNDTVYVLKRAALLIQELTGGKIIGEIQDIYPTKIENKVIDISYTKINTLIGKHLETNTVKSILTSLDIVVEKESDDILTISIPTYRVDVTRDVDVIEEILRIYGYNNVDIDSNLKSTLSYQTATDKSYELQNLLSEQLTGAGFSEILNNSLTKEAYYKESSLHPSTCSTYLLNPLSNDLNVLRQTLLYGGLENIAYNINRQHADIMFYEFGNCYYYNKEKKQEGENLREYTEKFQLGLWLSGNTVSNSWSRADEKSSVYQLKAHVENIFRRLGISLNRLNWVQTANEIYSSALDIQLKGSPQSIGMLGVVDAKKLKQLNINAAVFFAQLNWDLMMREISKHTIEYAEIAKFPAVERDFALLIDKNIQFEQIETIARKAERKLLKNITLFDVYEGKNLPEGKKSYAVKFILQDESQTLTDKQIDAIMQKIQLALQKEAGAQLR